MVRPGGSRVSLVVELLVAGGLLLIVAGVVLAVVSG
jgi:hypothetical protein